MARTLEPTYLPGREEKITLGDRFRHLRWSLSHLTGGAALLIGTLALTWVTAMVLLLDTFGVLPTTGLR